MNHISRFYQVGCRPVMSSVANSNKVLGQASRNSLFLSSTVHRDRLGTAITLPKRNFSLSGVDLGIVVAASVYLGQHLCYIRWKDTNEKVEKLIEKTRPVDLDTFSENVENHVQNNDVQIIKRLVKEFSKTENGKTDIEEMLRNTMIKHEKYSMLEEVYPFFSSSLKKNPSPFISAIVSDNFKQFKELSDAGLDPAFKHLDTGPKPDRTMVLDEWSQVISDYLLGAIRYSDKIAKYLVVETRFRYQIDVSHISTLSLEKDCSGTKWTLSTDHDKSLPKSYVTPLLYAMMLGKKELASFLVKKGAEITLCSRIPEKNTGVIHTIDPIEFALESFDLDMVKLLITPENIELAEKEISWSLLCYKLAELQELRDEGQEFSVSDFLRFQTLIHEGTFRIQCIEVIIEELKALGKCSKELQKRVDEDKASIASAVNFLKDLTQKNISR